VATRRPKGAVTARDSIFDFGAWVRRLQFKREDEPAFRYDVQPVQIVSDVSTLTPEVRSPAAIWGGQEPAFIVNFGIFDLTVNAPGGIIASDFAWSLSLFGSVSIRIQTTPGGFSVAPLATFPMVMEPPVRCTGLIGRTAVPPGGFPNLIGQFPGGGQTSPSYWPGRVFVPNGSHLLISSLRSNTEFRCAFTAQELPAMRGD